jgi:hypothetical protein
MGVITRPFCKYGSIWRKQRTDGWARFRWGERAGRMRVTGV